MIQLEGRECLPLQVEQISGSRSIDDSLPGGAWASAVEVKPHYVNNEKTRHIAKANDNALRFLFCTLLIIFLA